MFIQCPGSRSISLKSNLILSCHLRLGLSKSPFPSDHPSKTPYASQDCSICATCLIMLGEEYNPCSSALCNFLHSIVISSLLAPNIFLSTLFSNTLNLCFSLNVRDQISQPHNTTGNIIVSYVLTFSFLESRRDDKIFSSEHLLRSSNSEAYLNDS